MMIIIKVLNDNDDDTKMERVNKRGRKINVWKRRHDADNIGFDYLFIF